MVERIGFVRFQRGDQCLKPKYHPKKKKEEKAPTQIPSPSLGPKLGISYMKQIRQREGKESWKNAKLRRGFINDDGFVENGWNLGFFTRLPPPFTYEMLVQLKNEGF